MKTLIRAITLWVWIGVMAGFPARAGDTVKIAAIFAQTGEAAIANASSLHGVDLAVQDINAQGGILGKPLEVLVFDNRSTPIGSKIAADQAIAADVIAIIGAQWSSHSLVIAREAQTHQIPMLTNYSTNPDVTRVGEYIFRVCFIDALQGQALAQFARRDLKAATAVMLTNVTSDYSMGLADTFRERFEALEGRVLLELEYLQTERNFTELLQQAQQQAPDILFIPGHSESGAIVQQAQQLGIQAIPMGGDGWGEIDFSPPAGHAITRGYYSTHWSAEIDRPATQEFLRAHQKQEAIRTGTVLAYDAVLLLRDAIQRAGSFNRQAIRDALARTVNFEGVTGTITFNAQGDPIKDVVIMRILNGRAHYLQIVHP